MRHHQHALQPGGIKGRVGGGHEKHRLDVRGEDLGGGVAAGHLAHNPGVAGQDGLDHRLLLAGHQLDSHPVANLGQFGMIAARLVDELANDLRRELRIHRPDPVEMFVLDGHPRRDKSLRQIRRELGVAFGVPAELGQTHNKRWLKGLTNP